MIDISNYASIIGVKFTVPACFFYCEVFNSSKPYDFLVAFTEIRNNNGNATTQATLLIGDQGQNVIVRDWTLESSFVIKSDWTKEQSDLTITDSLGTSKTITVVSNPTTLFRGSRRPTATVATILKKFIKMSKSVSWEEFDLIEERDRIRNIDWQDERLLKINEDLKTIRRAQLRRKI